MSMLCEMAQALEDDYIPGDQYCWEVWETWQAAFLIGSSVTRWQAARGASNRRVLRAMQAQWRKIDADAGRS